MWRRWWRSGAGRSASGLGGCVRQQQQLFEGRRLDLCHSSGVGGRNCSSSSSSNIKQHSIRPSNRVVAVTAPVSNGGPLISSSSSATFPRLRPGAAFRTISSLSASAGGNVTHYGNRQQHQLLRQQHNPFVGVAVTTNISTTTTTVLQKRYTASMAKFQIVERGTENTTSYRVYYRDANGQAVSPFHDIPMWADEGKRHYNMVVEVPRWTNAKMEIATGEPLNPIKQDVKKEQLRFVKNCFPHHGYIWNYGAVPQTWEDPNSVDSHTGFKGDNDPIDICEIGHRVAKRGEVIQVKVLGVLALIDEGETDWKLIAIDVNDPMAAELNDVADVEKKMPGLLKATVEWFKIYKIPDGKPANKFAFDGQVKDRAFAEKVIADTHGHWVALMAAADTGKINCSSVTTEGAHRITSDEANSIVASTPELVHQSNHDSLIDKWYYVSA